MASKRPAAGDQTPSAHLEALVQRALAVTKKARKHHMNLALDNFYGNKLTELRADATNAFRDLASQSAGDTSAMAELIQTVFAPTTLPKDRPVAARELVFALRTTWKEPRAAAKLDEESGFFPLAILAKANRGYLITVGRQMNGCYSQGWYDGCAVMMRRLIEITIIEAFEHKGVAHKIKGNDGNYLHLSDLVTHALGEATIPLSRNAKKFLPQLRDAGHLSAHGRYYFAHKEDVDKVQPCCRVVVEEFLHHARLLP